MQISALHRIFIYSSVIKGGKNVCSSASNYNLPNILEKETKRLDALDNLCNDLSEVTPYFPKSFNLAAYVNKSELLQNLLHLDVNLSKIEKKPYIAEKILKLDFERDVKRHVMFLKDFVESEEMGNYITKNPMILCEPLEDLEVRVNYLKSKRFLNTQVQQIVSRNPYWLMFSTMRIDRRLGYFQENYSLSGDEVRYVSTKLPKLITYSLHHVKTNTFAIREEMGFEEAEVKQLIIKKPKLFMLNQMSLRERFNYLHNVVKIPHAMLLQYPEVLLCRNFKVKQRHLFLQKLGRAQYDPKKENYVPIIALVENTDTEFCKNYAKCSVDYFNVFIKTL